MDKKTPLGIPSNPQWLGFFALLMLSFGGYGMEFTGHHGGIVIHCNDPEFYHEVPPPNAKVSRLEKVSFIASDNTMTESLVVLVNLEPTSTRITRNGNGTFTVEADLSTPKTEGRAWIKVTGHSDDGCQQLHTWDVFIDQEGK